MSFRKNTPMDNRVIARIARENGPRLIEQAIKVLVAGAIVQDEVSAEQKVRKPSLGRRIASAALVRVATRSVPGAIIVSGWTKTLIFILVSPAIGFVLGAGLMIAVYWIFRNWTPLRIDRHFRKLQLLSAAAFSLGHGTNDAQKTMGIIAGVLLTVGLIDHFYVPFWVVLMAHAAIGLGTLAGGWRIVKTMGMRITKLRPVGGFCAETAAAASILGNALAGIPVSTTHTIAGGIMGVGSVQRLTAVNWGVAKTILWAWVLTIPISALASALCFRAIRWFIPAA